MTTVSRQHQWSPFMFGLTKKALAVGLTALTIGGSFAVSTPSAEAQPYYGRHYGPGPGYHRGYGYRPAYGGYYGPRYRYGYRGYPYYRRNNGAAVAAGVVGGLALGALAANAGRPVYYQRPVRYGDCWTERRRAYNRYGDLVIRRVRVCG
jgi:hypothetical protein